MFPRTFRVWVRVHEIFISDRSFDSYGLWMAAYENIGG